MSAPQSFVPADVALACAPVKPAHHLPRPNPTDESEEEKQGAAHVAPVARLYRHALESVFGFLTLADLSRLLRVSRSWSAAVHSMKTIGASVLNAPALHVVAASSLAPHIGLLHYSEDAVSADDLLLISRRLRSLTSLSCTVEMPHASRVYFGSTLQSLHVKFKRETHALLINDAIVTISSLPQLTDLTLWLPMFYAELNFAPLAAAARLLDLTLYTDKPSVKPKLHHLDQLRMLPQLRKMSVPRLSDDGLLYLLRAPHSLQWQQMGEVVVDDTQAATLSALPGLTTLFAWDCRSVAFLHSFTRLRTLELYLDRTVRLAADIVAGLSCCSQLTDLRLLAADVTSQHLSQALSRLPLLQILKLSRCPSLESLSFLSGCSSLAQSLQSLHFYGYRDAAVHSTELKHILTLKNLTALTIRCLFVEPLDAATRDSLQPPSLVLPALSDFSYIE